MLYMQIFCAEDQLCGFVLFDTDPGSEKLLTDPDPGKNNMDPDSEKSYGSARSGS